MNITARFIVLSMLALVAMALVIVGCSDRIRGDREANAKPQVYFVNIPPDGQKMSVNPVVFWVGTDGDGLIMQYRYIVVRSDEMSGMGPDEYVASVLSVSDESDWTYLDVSVDEPRTTNEIPAQADIDDPVNRFIPQYIFVQAIDDQGLGSDIVFRLILRNDFPPDTEIRGLDPTRIYINDEQAGAIVTGVPVRWRASDPDLEDSLFEFEWRVLGPYIDQDFVDLLDEHMVQVFVANDAKVYPFWQGERIIIIDTTYDSTGVVIDSTVIIVDTITQCNFFGCIDTAYLQMDSILIKDSILAESDPNYISKQLQWSGGWISSTKETLYDLFSTYDDDSTIVRNFLFWVRSRDQADVADLTPDWTSFMAIQPKYERGPIVIDFAKTIIRNNAPYPHDTLLTWDGQPVVIPQQYWLDVITAWDSEEGANMEVFNYYDSSKGEIHLALDYVLIDRERLRVSLKRLLSHKLIILYNDGLQASGISLNGDPTSNLGVNIYTAIDAGVNCWSVMRSPIYGGKVEGPKVGGTGGIVEPDEFYAYYFGVEDLVYSGWGFHAFHQIPNAGSHYEYDSVADSMVLIFGYFCDYRWLPSNKRTMRRIEDFVGAVSPTGWPKLKIDTALLRSRYLWSEGTFDAFPCYGWGQPFKWGGGDWPQRPLDPKIRALPEVNWASRVYGTELMYLYQSYYRGAHFMGELYNFDGTPVAHRLDRGIFRTVHFCFTPLAMDPVPMQAVMDEVLTWLFNPEQFEPTSTIRYPGATAETSVAKARKMYLEQVETQLQIKIDNGLISEEARR